MKRIFPLLIIVVILVLPSCFKDNKSDDYSQWRELNQQFFNTKETEQIDGVLIYQSLTPVWDNSFSILMRWHNNREETANQLSPLSNSTCYVKYTLTNIEGERLDSSASFKCVPNSMVTGFMAAIMNMHVNDTVTAILPYTAGYGVTGYSSVLPYSTLIFGIRLDSISKLM
ncbi:MAG: FKBP-type peptidyl-prolyl cis-trans isomerase [Muribaculaceae bacterium]|nr:FKBP-type peptidyl-prolyl cis-trans isomerase [Muribaculaceae bacterium]